MNAGRIQAQGGGTEKSSAWHTQEYFTKEMGVEHLENLRRSLTPAELRLRIKALEQSRNRIINCSIVGITAVSKKSYYDDFRNKKVRVDVEVLRGICFLDEPLL